MQFTDLIFLYAFFVICLIAYFITDNIRAKNAVLLVFSFIFYAWGDTFWVLLLIAVAFINYALSIFMDFERHKKSGKPKLFLVVGLLFNIGLLFVFKYTAFIAQNLNAFPKINLPVPSIALPLGISFYTFKAISYLMDVYWEKVKPERELGKFMLYLSLFPAVVAGPIVRYETVAEQLSSRSVKVADVTAGIRRMIFGLAKKAIIANNLYALADGLFGENIADSTVFGTWMGVIIYSMWVYFDFSGYSDMAIGIGQIFGFKFLENFDYPFISKTITEFWQRWHISLGTFFRDYLLYVPLFGLRNQTVSLFLVWFTTGLWHGASWNFIIWGLYFGVFLYIESKIGKKRMKKLNIFATHLYSKLVIIIGFGIFRFQTMAELGSFFKNLVALNGNSFSSDKISTLIGKNIYLIIVSIILCTPIVRKISQWSKKQSFGIVLVSEYANLAVSLVLLFVSTVFLVSDSLSSNPFLYIKF